MNFEKANQWLKQNYPQLERYEIRAATDILYYSFNKSEDGLNQEDLRPSSCRGFMNVVARTKLPDGTYGADVVLLMPEDV